jgi:hypothetical protein
MSSGFFLHSLQSHLSDENLLRQVFLFPVNAKIRYQSSSIIRKACFHLINTLIMRPLIRSVFTLFVLSFVIAKSFAGDDSVRPVEPALVQPNRIREVDSFLSARVSSVSLTNASKVSGNEFSSSSGRICSCQILNLWSANYDHRYVALLAEKSNDGSGSAYTVAKNRIQKEKKQLKKLFYDKVKVVAEMQGTGSCKSMFYQLRTSDSHLRLYEILNADIY